MAGTIPVPAYPGGFLTQEGRAVMADTQSKTTSSASTSRSKLSPASESGDPAVHQLLAEMDIANRNGDKEGVEAAKSKLAELGYE